MNDQQRAAMREAIATLVTVRGRIVEAGGSGWKLEAQRCVRAIDLMNEALAQREQQVSDYDREFWGDGQQEPVVWRCQYCNTDIPHEHASDCWVEIVKHSTTPPSVEAAIETKTTQHGGEYPIYTQQDMDDAIAETLEKAAKVCEEYAAVEPFSAFSAGHAKGAANCAAAIRSMK